MSQPVSHDEGFVLGLKRSSLEGRIIYACPHCSAPGVYSDHISIQMGWPACYDPARRQEPVGDTCPQCNKSRLPDLDHGELTASIPKWVWVIINYAKLLVVKALRVKRRITG